MKAILKILIATALLVSAPCVSQAAFTFLGPTPYKSAADSPFPVQSGDPNFFLEDFEDGLQNTPGLTMSFGAGTVMMVPSPSTDSVDSDDGTIDGVGIDGTSVKVRMAQDFSLPPIYSNVVRFEFAATAGNSLPTEFGVVWTDGPQPTSVTLIAFDQNGGSDASNFFGLGDSLMTGQTDEDRFLGVSSSVPLIRVSMNVYFQSMSDALLNPTFEYDHVQYGSLPVPEPGTGLVACCTLFLLMCFRSLH